MPKGAGWYRNERAMHQRQAPRLMRKQREERERLVQEEEQKQREQDPKQKQREQDLEIIQLGFVSDDDQQLGFGFVDDISD